MSLYYKDGYKVHYPSRRTIFCCASFKWHNRGIFVSTVKRFFSVSLFSDIMGHILAFNKPLIRGIEYPFKKVFLGKNIVSRLTMGKKRFYKDLRDFWLTKSDAIQRTLTFYGVILRYIGCLSRRGLYLRFCYSLIKH